MKKFFEILHYSKKSKARLGEINTVHGKVKTPGFIAAATKGTIKTLTPDLVKNIGIQAACFNTYHLVTHPGVDIIAKAGGIQKFSGLNIFSMSDSGGFQVFSLARSRDLGSKFLSQNKLRRKNSSPLSLDRKADIRGDEQPFLVKITDDGVNFRSTYDGKLLEFTPEKSIEYQMEIGADINMAFDECTYYPATHEYTEKAMKRTHEWLKRCISYKTRQGNFYHTRVSPLHGPLESKKIALASSVSNYQYLYGVIQGGIFEDLRKKSAEFVASQDTPGVAIGGVSVGEAKREMRDQVKWVADYLPKNRPVHLLGVGQMDDIIDLVKYGIDTFDCVEPTRLARMGIIHQMNEVRHQIFNQKLVSHPLENLDINKSVYKNKLESVDVDCDCYVCKNFTKSYLHHLFKQREILGYTLATYHNLWTMEKLFETIRELISQDKL